MFAELFKSEVGGRVGEGFGARSPSICLLGWLLAKDSTLESAFGFKKIKMGLFSPKGVIPISDWTNIDAHSSRVETNVNIKTEVRDIRERIRDD